MLRHDFSETDRIGLYQQTFPFQHTFHVNGIRVGFPIQGTSFNEESFPLFFKMWEQLLKRSSIQGRSVKSNHVI